MQPTHTEFVLSPCPLSLSLSLSLCPRGRKWERVSLISMNEGAKYWSDHHLPGPGILTPCPAPGAVL